MQKLNREILEDKSIKYLIAVDGGGTGTRIIVSDKNFKILATAHGPASALGQGVEKAWNSIVDTISRAFSNANLIAPMLAECAIGLGLSGANNIVWKNEFHLRNPGFKHIIVDTDGYTTLLGAHDGNPGVIVAVGTGSVGMLVDENKKRIDVSGWGFPAGDEASGAWLGLRASSLTQKTIDGRRPVSTLSNLVLNYCGNDPQKFLEWLGNANQNTFAKLAPLVFKAAATDDDAKTLLIKAGLEIEEMVRALDPQLKYPLSICGRLGEALIEYLPKEIKIKHVRPAGDSTLGAMNLLKETRI